jgi:hypothetical protein
MKTHSMLSHFTGIFESTLYGLLKVIMELLILWTETAKHAKFYDFLRGRRRGDTLRMEIKSLWRNNSFATDVLSS